MRDKQCHDFVFKLQVFKIITARYKHNAAAATKIDTLGITVSICCCCCCASLCSVSSVFFCYGMRCAWEANGKFFYTSLQNSTLSTLHFPSLRLHLLGCIATLRLCSQYFRQFCTVQLLIGKKTAVFQLLTVGFYNSFKQYLAVI